MRVLSFNVCRDRGGGGGVSVSHPLGKPEGNNIKNSLKTSLLKNFKYLKAKYISMIQINHEYSIIQKENIVMTHEETQLLHSFQKSPIMSLKEFITSLFHFKLKFNIIYRAIFLMLSTSQCLTSKKKLIILISVKILKNNSKSLAHQTNRHSP